MLGNLKRIAGSRVSWWSWKKCYHSENGVWGYRPRVRTTFDVSEEELRARARNSNFYRLVTAYREHAHKVANVNPIALEEGPGEDVELQPRRFGLELSDDVEFRGIISSERDVGTVGEALEVLDRVYCREIGAEFMHLESLEEREWFASALEKSINDHLDAPEKKLIAEDMLKSQTLDNFLASKFVSFKRYGCEGAESMLAFFREFFRLSGRDGLEQIVLCMPHRGRLNLLTGMLKFPPEKLFRKLLGLEEFPTGFKSTGDVASHFVASVDLETGLHVTMLSNPSHLEAVNPVSMGKTRGVMLALGDGAYSNSESRQWSDRVINLQVHGDAAYAGQGVNQECLALSRVPHFEIGGTVHLVVNNQLGFTTPGSRTRSSRYCTDLAKSISAPVLHVNGDNPEELVKATRIAFGYQRRFRRDVFIDLNCLRKWGHNELDNPTFTNPLVYRMINSRLQSVPDSYRDKLEQEGILEKGEAELMIETCRKQLGDSLKRADKWIPRVEAFAGRWTGLRIPEENVTTWDTGADLDLVRYVAWKSVEVGKKFDLHPTLSRSHVGARIKRISEGGSFDWATAESVAFGTLMHEGFSVRISGQDVGRGTFSHRHVMLVDQTTGAIEIPLNSLAEGEAGRLEVANSPLSEEAVLGYEYGLSTSSPKVLVLWEAQFGDFFNSAQVIIDTFVSSGEAKWTTSSGLTILLPHGYDGAGPEHSSCRLERFLQLTDSKETKPDSDNVNFQVANPTTPAQYFHLLRRQMIRDFRKPLVIVSPKTLLRHPAAVSPIEDLAPGTSFKNVIGDDSADPERTRRIIFVSGKHFYALREQRELLGAANTAIVRVEGLCPFPLIDLDQELKKYPNAETFVWSQEEPRNMGAWSFIKPRFENLCGRPLKYCGRESLPAPAVGINLLHQQEAREVVLKPFSIK